MERIQLSKQAKDITGQKFGLLTALYPIGIKLCGKSKQMEWKCECECGNKTNATVGVLMSGSKKSCGCLKLTALLQRSTKHGLARSPEYSTWAHMIQRCTNSNDKDYHNYGGRGIKVCDRWLESFQNFYDDMGPKPSSKHSIDRMDNDGDYCSENCQWVTTKEQANNTRQNRYLISGKEVKTLRQWSIELGRDMHSITRYLDQGKNMEWIVNHFRSKMGQTNFHLITFNGETLNRTDWARKLDINYETLRHYIRKGMPGEEALAYCISRKAI
jgi:hypothetical protein